MESLQFVIAVAEGALGASVGATLDVLGVASRGTETARQRRIAWRVVGMDAQVRLSNGMAVAAQPLAAARIPATAMLVFPGIGLDRPPPKAGSDIRERYRDAAVLRRMAMPDAQAFARLAARHRARGGRVAASCSGVLLLAMAGLLDHRRATTHWRLGEFFSRHFPLARMDTHRMVVDDDGLVSAGAAMAQLDLMLYLIRQHAGRDLAELVSRYLLIDGRATQARYQVWEQLSDGEDTLAARLETLIEASLPRVPSMQEAARQLNTTPKTLARHVFKATGGTPLDRVQAVRMRHAQHLLALGDLSLDEVAQRVGYANATSLRKLTMRMAHLPPAMLRHAPGTEPACAAPSTSTGAP